MARQVLKLLGSGVLVLGGMLLLGLLVTHVLVHGSIGHLDDAIERSLNAGRTSTWNSLTKAGTALADPLNAEVALAVLVLLVAVLTRRLAPPLFLAMAVGVESAIYFTTSTLVPRARPHVPRFGPADPMASYPSGHVAAAICLYGGLAVIAWRCSSSRVLRLVLTVVACVVPVVVGYSRMYRGYHHLSDIVAGALLGATWLWLCAHFLLINERQVIDGPARSADREPDQGRRRPGVARDGDPALQVPRPG